MAHSTLAHWLFSPYESQNNHFHRRCLIVSGGESWCSEVIDDVLKQRPQKLSAALLGRNLLVNQNASDKSVTSAKSRQHLLGQTVDIGVVFCFDDFRPSDVLALAGTIQYYGTLIIVCPELDQWTHHLSVTQPAYLTHGFNISHSGYIARFISSLEQYHLGHYTQKDHYFPTYKQAKPHAAVSPPFRSKDQVEVFAQWNHKWQLKEKSNPFNAIVTGARGRGKSTLISIWIESLLADGLTIAVTSSHVDSVSPIVDRDSLKPYLTNGKLAWLATDNPTLCSANYDLLVVDEAASIPVPTLLRLLDHHTHWLLSTTMFGYEGSGQGFYHRMLFPLIENGAHHYQLNTPLRWYEDDPVEQWLNDTLLFSPLTQEHLPSENIDNETLRYEITQFSTLSELELQQVMKLLSLAHYQTSPDDMMRMIDAPDLMLCVQRINGRTVGATIVNIEGGAALSGLEEDIAKGARRPKGHLGVQRLALLCASPELLQQTYWRINRIAVLPELQGNGLGSAMLNYIQGLAQSTGIDGLLSSFGSTPQLTHFWQQNQFELVDKGVKPNKASGQTSGLVIKALSERSKQCSEKLSYLYTLGQSPKDFAQLPSWVRALYLAKLNQFCEGCRNLDSLGTAIQSIANEEHFLVGVANRALIVKQLTQQSINISELQQYTGVNGKKAVIAWLRQQVRKWLEIIEH